MGNFWKRIIAPKQKHDRKREQEAASIATKSIRDEMNQTRDKLAALVEQMGKAKGNGNAQS